jgi:hypothetical protein
MERGQHPQAYCGTVPYMFYISTRPKADMLRFA